MSMIANSHRVVASGNDSFRSFGSDIRRDTTSALAQQLGLAARSCDDLTDANAVAQHTALIDFFRRAYVPARLPGVHHHKSRLQYEGQIEKLNIYFEFLQRERSRNRGGAARRPIALHDLSDALLKNAMEWWMQPEPWGKIRRANSAATANKLYRHIKSVWNMAWSEFDLVDRNCRTKPYREIKRKPRAWRRHQVTQIVEAAFRMPGMVGAVPANVWWPAQVLMDLNLGSRISAAMDILTANLDLDRGQVWLAGETQKHRADEAYDLFPSTIDALRQLAPHERGLKYVFGDWPFDKDRTWHVLRKHLRKLLVLAGLFETINDVTRDDLFHQFRKVVATQIAAKRGIEEAKRYLGHSTSQVTARYVDEMQLERPRANELLIDPIARPGATG